MLRYSLLLLCFTLTINVTAQKKLSVVYESGFDADAPNSLRRIKILLAINDSVGFITTVSAGGKEVSSQLPLGSKFHSHNQYIHPAKNTELIQSHPMGRRKYLVADTVKKLTWFPAEGEKKILGYTCKKAEAQDGNTTLVAWYAPDLPFSFGPNGFTNLPGLTLELSAISSQHTQKAVSIENSAPEIVEPEDGKRIDRNQFRKMLADLRK